MLGQLPKAKYFLFFIVLVLGILLFNNLSCTSGDTPPGDGWNPPGNSGDDDGGSGGTPPSPNPDPDPDPDPGPEPEPECLTGDDCIQLKIEIPSDTSIFVDVPFPEGQRCDVDEGDPLENECVYAAGMECDSSTLDPCGVATDQYLECLESTEPGDPDGTYRCYYVEPCLVAGQSGCIGSDIPCCSGEEAMCLITGHCIERCDTASGDFCLPLFDCTRMYFPLKEYFTCCSGYTMEFPGLENICGCKDGPEGDYFCKFDHSPYQIAQALEPEDNRKPTVYAYCIDKGPDPYNPPADPDDWYHCANYCLTCDPNITVFGNDGDLATEDDPHLGCYSDKPYCACARWQNCCHAYCSSKPPDPDNPPYFGQDCHTATPLPDCEEEEPEDCPICDEQCLVVGAKCSSDSECCGDLVCGPDGWCIEL